MIMRYRLLLLCVLLLSASCAREAPAPPYSAYEARLKKALDGQDWEAAVSTLEDALRIDAYMAQHPALFNLLIGCLLRSEDPTRAEARYLAAAEHPKWQQAAFYLIPEYYLREADDEGLVTWTGRLMGTLTFREQYPELYRLNMTALDRLGRSDVLRVRIEQCLANLEPDAAVAVLSQLKRAQMLRSDLGAVEQLLSVLETAATQERVALLRLYRLTRFDWLLARGAMDEAETMFFTVGPMLDARDLAQVLSRMLAASAWGERPESRERLAVYALERHATNRLAVAVAARAWMQAGIDRELASGELIVRLRQILGMETEPKLHQVLFRSSLYEAARREDSAMMREVLKLVGELYAAAPADDPLRDGLRGLLLDGYFLLEDYEAALAVYENLPADARAEGYDMVINKIKAHMAERNGRVDEAVERYRNFMAHIDASWKGDERDPVTGIRHSKLMALGFNAKRIGDIYWSHGRRAEAREAYAQARQELKMASAEVKTNSLESAYINSLVEAMRKPGEEVK